VPFYAVDSQLRVIRRCYGTCWVCLICDLVGINQHVLVSFVRLSAPHHAARACDACLEHLVMCLSPVCHPSHVICSFCICSSRHHLIPACCGASVVYYTLFACVVGIIVVNSNVSRYGDIRGVLSMHPSPWSTLSDFAFPILALSIVFPSLLVLFTACLQ